MHFDHEEPLIEVINCHYKSLILTINGAVFTKWHLLFQFPLRDGRMLDMLRIKNPYATESLWQAEFSLR